VSRARFGFGVALCGALVAWAPSAMADEIVPALSLQTGFTFTRQPGNDSDDYFVAATPSITYLMELDRLTLSATYAFTGSLNLTLPNGIANRLVLTAAYDLSTRARLLFGVEALQALVGNYLLVRRAADGQIGQLPPLNSSLLTITGSQGFGYEISPVTRFTQGLIAAYVTSLDPDVTLSNYLASATFNIDRAWEFDAVGGELNVTYARSSVPPFTYPLITTALGPTWDHDWTRNITTSANVSAQLVASPDSGTTPRIGPAGRASALFFSEGSGIEASYTGGVEPNLLFGTLLQSHTAIIRGYTPISERNAVIFGLSGGFLHAKNVDIDNNGQFDNEFDAVLHDADVSWAPAEWLTLFARYQFIGQGSGSGTGVARTLPIVRHGAILGAELFGARPIERRKVQTRFPQRVDRGDAPKVPVRR
jgi:hypothetical protein